MKKLPRISEAEFEVMKIIWNHAPVSTNDVVAHLSEESAWSPKTIHTMLVRLEKKGVLTHSKEGRVFIYHPLIEKEVYIAEKSHSFLNQFYSGTLNKMVVNLMEQDLLSTEELDELRQILNRKRDEQEK